MIIVFLCLTVSAVFALVLLIIHKTGSSGILAKLKNRGQKAKLNNENTYIQDYNKYEMSLPEKIKYFLIASTVILVIAYIFFKNIFICMVLCSLSLLYPRYKRGKLIRKRKEQLNLQFKDLLQSISSSLSAGRSVESAFRAAVDDLRLLYSESDVYIIREVELICRKLDNNETLQNALIDFAERADIEDIRNFVDVFVICKKSGGNLVDVIKNTSNIINQKIEIKNEINILVAEQKFNQKILNIMPFGLVILISASSPDYIQPLYSIKGHFIMLFVLILLVASYVIGEKITDIKV